MNQEKWSQDTRCHDWRSCFARKAGRCSILQKTYEQDQCPFAKREQEEPLSYFAAGRREKVRKALTMQAPAKVPVQKSQFKRRVSA